MNNEQCISEGYYLIEDLDGERLVKKSNKQLKESKMPTKIIPTVGRVVHFYPAKGSKLYNNDRPLAAMICHIHDDSMVNLVVHDCNGDSHSKTSIRLFQAGESPHEHDYCCWMDYQLGQAEKTKQAEEVASSARRGFKS